MIALVGERWTQQVYGTARLYMIQTDRVKQETTMNPGSRNL